MIPRSGVSVTSVNGGTGAVLIPTLSTLTYFHSGANTTWAAMPLAETIALGTGATVQKADLTSFTQIRIGTYIATAGAAAAVLYAKYRTGAWSGNIANFTDLIPAASGVSLVAGTTGVFSSWVTIPAGALGDVWIAIAGAGGDGITSPVFRGLVLQYR